MADAKILEGRHAVVTGGGRGIGAAIAEELAALGADLTLISRDRAVLEDRRAALAAKVKISIETADVSDADAVAAAFKTAENRLGPVHILINNAGAARSAPFEKLDLAHWNAMLAVNLTGSYLCCRAVVPGMKHAGWGRIVNVASTAGLIGYRYIAAYAAAKHGVIGLTRALALELAQTGVTVNAVCPGYTDTDMVKSAVDNIAAKTGRSAAEARAELARANPQGRLIAPEEVAQTVAWLCLPASAAITGQAIPIAGGEVMS
ncbi:MAG: SDR family oxidoreductase [Alphaproteobacteria bacterium]|nr:SDR family oxidoreductase [Alphaproteobacteria bacterium]